MPKFSTVQALRSSSVDDSKKLQTQSLKFLLTGIVAAIVDFSLTWILQIGLEALAPFWARTVGFIFGTLTAYLLNRAWTFRAQKSFRRFAAVALLYTMTYLINVGGSRLLFELFSEVFGWADSIALAVSFVIAQGTATVINFFVQRLFIFKNAEPI